MHVRRRTNVFALVVMLLAAVSTIACGGREPKPGTVLDEAMQAKRTVDTFPAADEDYFHDMIGEKAADVIAATARQTAALGPVKPSVP